MNIIVAKIGDWVKRHRQDIWLGLCVVLVGWSAYNLGTIRGKEQSLMTTKTTVSPQTAKIDTPPDSAQGKPTPTSKEITPKATAHNDIRVVASKSSSSKKYHFSWCTSASAIKPENRLWFDTAQIAQAAGYTLAANCH